MVQFKGMAESNLRTVYMTAAVTGIDLEPFGLVSALTFRQSARCQNPIREGELAEKKERGGF